MQTPLPPEVLASVARDLTLRAQTRGTPEILGAQLGKLINEALSPRHVREFGGLRQFVETELATLVRVQPGSLGSADLTYEILNAPPPAAKPLSVPQDFVPVAGADLWRFFSNPNVSCRLAVQQPATVLVGPPEMPLPLNSIEIDRIGTPVYRELAEAFQQERSGDPLIAPVLREALSTGDFYKHWISALRRLRTPAADLLKSWEILRTARVATAMTSELTKAGVELSRVAEIVQLATPVSRAVKHHVGVPFNPAVSSGLSFAAGGVRKPSFYGGGEAWGPAEDTAELRDFLHRAIDAMAATELRDIRISAGTLMKMTSKARA